ncbi:retrotransposon-derived protein PEG10 [Ascaphus truei]|uniref:retrotransposon-derived protein PEG10 n=1 Tax=Ascaphus truei TaxID=8439 RepID=UPI003F5A7EE8
MFSKLEKYLEQSDLRMDTVQKGLQTLSVQVQQANCPTFPPPPLASPVNPCSSDPRLPAPHRYSGDPLECRGFLNQCFIQFELTPSRFPSSRTKVAYIVSLLTGDALAWASPIWEQRTDLTQDIGRFTKEFRRVFDTPGRKITAASSLLHISQGDRPVARYALEFRKVAAETAWNDEALSSVFWQDLSEQLKDELAAHEHPSDLEGLIAICIRVDQRLQERRSERSHHHQVKPRTSLIHSSFPEVPATDVPEPMQLGGNKLSTSKKQRRRSVGLCLYCGNSGHFVPQCPLKPAPKAGNASSH